MHKGEKVRYATQEKRAWKTVKEKRGLNRRQGEGPGLAKVEGGKARATGKELFLKMEKR